MKVNTIGLNSVRLNTIALNHIGEIRSGGGVPPSLIPQWIREHVVFYYDVKKQGATNETLKESAYLQDLSGKGRRMKLNNFLFAEMSGVGGYNTDFSKWAAVSSMGSVDRISNAQIIIRNVVNAGGGLFHYPLTKGRVFLKCNITGITEGLKGKIVFRYSSKENYFKNKILDNGYFEFDSDIESNNGGWVGFTSTEPIDNCNITITQIPEYPGALVTDGVNDYGLVENLSSGVKMLFMTVNPMEIDVTLYDQRKVLTAAFSVYNKPDTIAYNSSNPGGSTYINGELNENTKTNSLLDTKQVITIVNDTVSIDNTKVPFFFRNTYGDRYTKMAFYNSIAFDSIPTEADGFTEQELIDYVLTNIIGQ